VQAERRGNHAQAIRVTAPMTWRPLVLLLALVACAAVPQPALDGTEWLSIGVTEEGADRPLVDGTRIRLLFDDGQLSASAACNSYGGAYELVDERLVVAGGGMTEIGCDDERHAQDEWLFGFLEAQPLVAREGDKLTLASNGTVIALEDREVAEPDLPLTGTTWTVDSIISGDAVSSVPAGATATLVFTDDGRIEVDNGCNIGGGVFEVVDGSIRVDALTTTLRACDAPGAQLESAVMGVLNAGEVDVSIEAGSLTLTAGDQGLVLLGE
jgi:heat shock protein HslJ